jgi:galactoside O-acetyltransferase
MLGRLLWQMYRTSVLVEFGLRRRYLGLNHFIDRLPYADGRLLPELLRPLGTQIGNETRMEPPVYLNVGGVIAHFRLLQIGQECYIGKNVLLDVKGGIVIGNRVTIAMGSAIITHLDVGRSRLSEVMATGTGAVHIGDDCYLGANVTVLPGVHIGDFCFIGAGAVVTRDLPSRSKAVGVPARVLCQLQVDDDGECQIALDRMPVEGRNDIR